MGYAILVCRDAITLDKAIGDVVEIIGRAGKYWMTSIPAGDANGLDVIYDGTVFRGKLCVHPSAVYDGLFETVEDAESARQDAIDKFGPLFAVHDGLREEIDKLLEQQRKIRQQFLKAAPGGPNMSDEANDDMIIEALSRPVIPESREEFHAFRKNASSWQAPHNIGISGYYSQTNQSALSFKPMPDADREKTAERMRELLEHVEPFSHEEGEEPLKIVDLFEPGLSEHASYQIAFEPENHDKCYLLKTRYHRTERREFGSVEALLDYVFERFSWRETDDDF